MRVNELRIGNWIKYTYALSNDIEFCKVTGVKNDDRVYFFRSDGCKISLDANEIEPIELTEKLLYRIGFCFGGVSGYGKHYVKSNGNDTLWCKIYESGNMSLTCNNNANLIQLHKVKFLHQLQNAYYLLTGEELEVEL